MDDGQLEVDQEAVSDMSPSIQDLLSISALINVFNDMSAPKVVSATPDLFGPLADQPIFNMRYWAEVMKYMERELEVKVLSLDSLQVIGDISLPPYQGTPLGVE